MKASTTFQQKLGNVSKLNRPIPSSAVGAGIACPKTQSQLFSDERTSSPRTKRQHYPRFGTASCATLAAPGKHTVYVYHDENENYTLHKDKKGKGK